LARRPEGKRPFGRPMYRWDDIRMDLGKVEWGGVE